MHLNNLKAQAGVGLIEVLVALILLAIGVLGYVALQIRAMDASSEALTKSQAMIVMRGLAENIRTNSVQAGQYPAFVRSYSNFSSTTVAPTSCFNTPCTPSQLAQFDAYQTAKKCRSAGYQNYNDKLSRRYFNYDFTKAMFIRFLGKNFTSNEYKWEYINCRCIKLHH